MPSVAMPTLRQEAAHRHHHRCELSRGLQAREVEMATWRPDPSFYPSPRLAAMALPESLACVAMFDPERMQPDGFAVVDVDPKSRRYSRLVATVEMSNVGDELHLCGWNACSSCLCP